MSSQDGFCSLVEFENDELGSPFSISGGKVSEESNSPLQISNNAVIIPTRNVSAIVAQIRKTEAGEKSDDMVIDSTGNGGSTWSRKPVILMIRI